MKRHVIILGLFLLIGLHAYSDNQIEISLLTCSSGSESFTAWGHSAIRVIDKKQSIDIVYNFGLFDFDTPNFYLKFVKGKLKYKLGIHSTNRFFRTYFSENRQIIEQKLNLSDEDEIRIISKLEYLYKPENRYYYYDFSKKNCTSELRDLIFNNVETDFQNQNINKTYRIQINEYLTDKLWLKFGMNLIFGTGVDKKIDNYESMFLPDYLYWGLNNIKVNNKKLVSSETTFNKVEKNKSNYPFLLNPIFLFSVLLIIVLIYKSSKIQVPIFLITGITGLLILIVWLLTEHDELKNNFNLLWCNPLYLAIAFSQIKNNVKLKMYLSIILQAMLIGVVV
ncbi:MAG: DUF4105 domain-containing protein, partial [Bacteroidales bacterium]|nr:DUF4105 domain-containing protein [Bacteroidales bacterium]